MIKLISLSERALLVVSEVVAAPRASGWLQGLAATLRGARLPGVTEVVPAFDSIGVHYDPRLVTESAGATAGQAAPLVEAWVHANAKRQGWKRAKKGSLVEVPACFGGEQGGDLSAFAKAVGLTSDQVVAHLCATVFEVACVGFVPGFPYLSGLPKALHLARRATPRVSVPAGSVAIGGAQAGIYPQATPGGWHLLGRTPWLLFDPRAPAPARFEPGQRIRFKAIDANRWARLAAEQGVTPSQAVPPVGVIEVEQPGALTTVQDLGRVGWQHLGVTEGGVVDRQSAIVANRLLGNPDSAAVLECTLTGPVLHFAQSTWIAVTGATVAGVPGWRRLRVGAGERVSLTRFVQGLRAYVAVEGGIAVETVLGGAGTDLRAGFGGFGGRALQAGDWLSLVGTKQRVSGGVARPVLVVGPSMRPKGGRVLTVRFVRGPEWAWFTEEARARFVGTPFVVSPKSDRMGLRLSAGDAATLSLLEPREMVSSAVAAGTVQVPVDGRPIVLLADRQTIGGYPRLAAVIAADLPGLGQLGPGATVRFVEVSIADAEKAWARVATDLRWLSHGLAAREDGPR